MELFRTDEKFEGEKLSKMNHATLKRTIHTLEQNYGSVCEFVPLQGPVDMGTQSNPKRTRHRIASLANAAFNAVNAGESVGI
jgi:hypothetical protein